MASPPESRADLAAIADAYRDLESLRWPAGPRCPHCAGDRVYFLTPATEVARRTRTGRPTARRVWKCSRCRRQFSVLTGTIWHGTRLAVPTWVSIVGRCARDGVVPRMARLREEWALSEQAAQHVHTLLTTSLAHVPAGDEAHLLAALLGIQADKAARLRTASVRRARPLRQVGPVADHGGD